MIHSPYGSQIYSSPTYFSATYLSAQTLTLAGLPWVPTNAQILGVEVDTIQGTVQVYPRTNFKISIDPATLILTVTGAGFLATDLAYRVFFIGVDKGYSPGTNSFAVAEASPLNQVVLEEQIVYTTDLANGTYYYPSDDGLMLLGAKSLSLSGRLANAHDSVLSVELQTTSDSNVVAASRDWNNTYGYRLDTNTIVNIIAIPATGGGDINFGWDFDDLNVRYARVRLITNDATNTIRIFARRVAL